MRFFKKKRQKEDSEELKKTMQSEIYPSLEELQKVIEDSNKALADMKKADAEYKEDGNIEKRIATYEKYLLEKPQWQAMNYCLALAKMYIKTGRNNQAWGYLNKMYLWINEPGIPGGDISKIRMEQFKILKSEKKYSDALVMLVASYVIKSSSPNELVFNKEKFKKDAKTTAKGLGLSEMELSSFADVLEKNIRTKIINENDVKCFCEEYMEKVTARI